MTIALWNTGNHIEYLQLHQHLHPKAANQLLQLFGQMA